LKDFSTDTVTNFTVPVPSTSLVVQTLTGNNEYAFNVTAVSMFRDMQLYSNVTSVSVATPTGSEFYKFDFDYYLN